MFFEICIVGVCNLSSNQGLVMIFIKLIRAYDECLGISRR